MPAKAPATQQQTADVVARLGRHRGSATDSLAAAVAADSQAIGFDLAFGKSVSTDAAVWQRDARALRVYCR